MEHENGRIGVRAVSANAPDRASKCAIDRRDVTVEDDPYELPNVVETALAKALVLAAEAKRWDVVIKIADELHARSANRRPTGLAGAGAADLTFNGASAPVTKVLEGSPEQSSRGRSRGQRG